VPGLLAELGERSGAVGELRLDGHLVMTLWAHSTVRRGEVLVLLVSLAPVLVTGTVDLVLGLLLRARAQRGIVAPKAQDESRPRNTSRSDLQM